MLTRSAALVLTVLAVGCSASSDAGPPGRVAGTRSVVPTTPAPSFPADATFANGATATIPLKASRGNLYVVVESKRTLAGSKTTLRVQRQKDCHVDQADGDSHLFVCTTVYDRSRTLPEGAFTFDATLERSSLTTTVEGTALTVTWVGYGDVRRKHNQNGNLLTEARDAKASTTWGRVTFTDKDGTDSPSVVYQRVTPKRPTNQ